MIMRGSTALESANALFRRAQTPPNAERLCSVADALAPEAARRAANELVMVPSDTMKKNVPIALPRGQGSGE